MMLFRTVSVGLLVLMSLVTWGCSDGDSGGSNEDTETSVDGDSDTDSDGPPCQYA